MTVPTFAYFVPTVPTPRGNKKTTLSCGLDPSVPTVPTYLNIYKGRMVAGSHTQLPGNFGQVGGNGFAEAHQSRTNLRVAGRSHLTVPTPQKEGTVR
jgi:hypothetical protein